MPVELEFAEARREGDETLIDVTVPDDARYFEGHFPGSPILPGVAQIIALTEEPARKVWPDLGSASGLRRVKFQQAIRPGDLLQLNLKRTDMKVTFKVLKDGNICSKGVLVF